VHAREVYNLMNLLNDMGSFFAGILVPIKVLAQFVNQISFYNKLERTLYYGYKQLAKNEKKKSCFKQNKARN